MNKTVRNITVAVGAGLLLGWIVSSYNFAEFFRTSAWSLIPWGIAGVLVALLGRTKKEIWLLSLLYSVVLTTSFIISGDQAFKWSQLVGLSLFGMLSGLVGTAAIGVAASSIRMDWPIKVSPFTKKNT